VFILKVSCSSKTSSNPPRYDWRRIT